jgi:hypothetical protein
MAMNQPRSGHKSAPSILFAVGLFFVYLGERILEAGGASAAMTWLGLALAVGATGWRLVEGQRARSSARPAQLWLAGLSGMGLLALLFYFINSSLTFKLTGHNLDQSWPRLSAIFSALWVALLVAGILPMLFGELSLGTMKRAPVVDLGRVKAAMMSALGLSFALVFCFSVYYVASERDAKVDLAYFRTAKAGDATKQLVHALDKPVQVYLFFPPANDVREEVESYFADLTRESKQLVVEQYDHALHPAKARELGVSGNGVIVIGRDALREQINMPLQIEQARNQLKILDQEVNKRIMGVSRPNRVAYFTRGHDERGFAPAGDTDRRGTVRVLKDLLTDMNFEPKELGMAQGLGADVPADAAVVLILGPRKPFFKEEMDALLRYLDRKGRLLIALDPESGDVANDLLAALSLKFNPATLANDQMFLAMNHQDSDRINIATASYSSHTSVSTVGRMGMQGAAIFLGAGSLQKAEKGAPGIVNVDFTVHAHPATWNDLNGNFQFDSGSKEVRMAYELAAAVSKRNASALAVEDESRAVVLADSDVLTDLFLQRSPGCHYLVRDAVRWLGGEAQITGTINNEEDVAILHTRRQDQAWFYGSIFLVPAMVVGAGVLMTRRRARKKVATRPGPQPTASDPPPPAAPEVTP